MTVRIAQFVHATSDVVDEAFLREFPEVEAVKPMILKPCPMRSAARKLVRDKGRALKWIQFMTVGIDIALKARLPEGV